MKIIIKIVKQIIFNYYYITLENCFQKYMANGYRVETTVQFSI